MKKNKRINKTSPYNLAKVYKYYSDIDESILKKLLETNSEKKHFEKMILIHRNETKEKYLKMIVYIDYLNGVKSETICNMYDIKQNELSRFISSSRKKIVNDIKQDINFTIQRKTEKAILKEYAKKIGVNIFSDSLELEKKILIHRNETKAKYLRMIVFIDYLNGVKPETICNKYDIKQYKLSRFIVSSRKKIVNDIRQDIELKKIIKFTPEIKKEINRELLKDWEKFIKTIKNAKTKTHLKQADPEPSKQTASKPTSYAQILDKWFVQLHLN